jgi:hypothetical protein
VNYQVEVTPVSVCPAKYNGIALGYSIQLGLSIETCALIPFVIVSGFAVRAAADYAFLAGLAAMVAGVIVCARPGRVASQPPVTAGCPHGRMFGEWKERSRADLSRMLFATQSWWSPRLSSGGQGLVGSEYGVTRKTAL